MLQYKQGKLEVQTYLETCTFKRLGAEYGIFARCDKNGNKFSLNYDTILAPKGVLMVEQCRGLILATKGPIIPHKDGKIDENFCPGETTVIAYPFDKFYNEEQAQAVTLKWDAPGIYNKLSIQDKMDGTLCIVYFDPFKNEWCVATRSVPDADLPLDGWEDMSFRKLFEKGVEETMGKTFERMTRDFPRDVTFMFELTSPYNRIFVNYKETRITLIGTRDNISLKESDPDTVMRGMNRYLPRPETWALHSVEDVRAFVNGRSPEECEGAVVVDQNFRRTKIKNINWVIANSTKSSLGASPRNLMRYVLLGVSDDITSMLPEDLKTKLTEMENGVAALFKKIDHEFVVWKEDAGSDRRRFAELVNLNAEWVTPLFKMWEGKFASTSELIKDLIDRQKLGDNLIDHLIKIIKKDT